MIYALSASDDRFRRVDFKPGFNLILANRSNAATDTDSRNALGKSSLVELIHFGLGSRGSRGDFPVIDPLDGWSFRIDVDLLGSRVGFTRRTGKANEIVVDTSADVDLWPLAPKTRDSKSILSVTEQRKLLGRAWFGLTDDVERTERGPTYRSLFSYFARRGGGAVLRPFKTSTQQLEWDSQVNAAYLLGLNWRDAAALQQLKEKQKTLRELQSAAERGKLPSYLRSEGTLNTERVRLRREIAQATERLESFEVRDDYREIEREASALTEQIHQLVSANARDRRFVGLYAERVDAEAGGELSGGEVARLFEEARVVLPDAVTRQLGEVEAFHAAVVANRRNYLSDEIERLESAIRQRELTVDGLDQKRSQLMQILDSAGALEERAAFQKRVNALSAQLGEVESQLKLLAEITHAKRDWEAEQLKLRSNMERAFEELGELRDRAIELFDQNCQTLYQSPGRLIIELRDKGFHFDVEVDGAGSQGISSMEVFCFDLMLMQLWSGRDQAPPALVHDSVLFDGVDERQVAAALQLAADESERLGFQYICTLNSDALPTQLLDENSEVLKPPVLELHDHDPSGSLFGFRFNVYGDAVTDEPDADSAVVPEVPADAGEQDLSVPHAPPPQPVEAPTTVIETRELAAI